VQRLLAEELRDGTALAARHFRDDVFHAALHQSFKDAFRREHTESGLLWSTAGFRVAARAVLFEKRLAGRLALGEGEGREQSQGEGRPEEGISMGSHGDVSKYISPGNMLAPEDAGLRAGGTRIQSACPNSKSRR
jgi:hypothetical protein